MRFGRGERSAAEAAVPQHLVAMAAMVAHHPLVVETVASDAVALREAAVAEQPSVAQSLRTVVL